MFKGLKESKLFPEVYFSLELVFIFMRVDKKYVLLRGQFLFPNCCHVK
jgi:hypothetical protein